MIIDFTDYSLGLSLDDFETIEEKYNYSFISKKGNILSGGVKRQSISFFEKICNYLMKQGRNTGKKEKCYNQLVQILESIQEQTNKDPVLIFVKAILKGMPLRSIRRERRGSGKITRAVYLSPNKKLIFSVGTLTRELSQKRKRSKGYIESFAKEIILAYKGDPSSILLVKRKEAEAYAESSNY